MHFFQKENECLMELFTSKADGLVLYRYPLYNTLKNVSYREAAIKDQDTDNGCVREKGGITQRICI